MAVDHGCESGEDDFLEGGGVLDWGGVGGGYAYVVVESEVVASRGELLECSWFGC